jgi:hypothetical protein
VTSASAVLRQAATAGLSVTVSGNSLLVHPASRLTDDLRRSMKAVKPELLVLLAPRPAPPALEARLSTLLYSERRLLGLLDACGPLDARNLARAAASPQSIVIQTLRRLRAADLVAFGRPFWHLAPRVVRWVNELELEERTA